MRGLATTTGIMAWLWNSAAWGADAVGRISLASRQLGGAGTGSGDHPLRAVAVALVLGVALAVACHWVRRSHPEEVGKTRQH